jgi:hypothetical protein
VILDDAYTDIMLAGVDAKNGMRCRLPLRADVSKELRGWIQPRTEEAAVMDADEIAGEPFSNVPEKLVRIIARDIAAAGIGKRDRRGFTRHVHSLRGGRSRHIWLRSAWSL